MNLYFLVEGDCTEKILYPKWIEYVLPNMKEVEHACDATENNYFIISGGGVPSIYDHIDDAISTINDIQAEYDHFILVQDSDGVPIETLKNEINEQIDLTRLRSSTRFHILIQHPCIETWLLSNRRFYRRSHITQDLRNCLDFYNVFDEDPEFMDKPSRYPGSIAHYHELYLKKVFLSRTSGRITYKKENPSVAASKTYWENIVSRYLTCTSLDWI